MKTPRLALITMILALPILVSAAEVEAWIERYEGGRAITITGKTILAKHDQRPPWQDDITNAVSPQYSRSERFQRHEGKGMFRISLNPNTGRANSVEVTKSTGFRALDESTVRALRQWHWKPGKWREIEIPVTFKITKDIPPAPAGTTRLPVSQ